MTSFDDLFSRNSPQWKWIEHFKSVFSNYFISPGMEFHAFDYLCSFEFHMYEQYEHWVCCFVSDRMMRLMNLLPLQVFIGHIFVKLFVKDVEILKILAVAIFCCSSAGVNFLTYRKISRWNTSFECEKVANYIFISNIFFYIHTILFLISRENPLSAIFFIHDGCFIFALSIISQHVILVGSFVYPSLLFICLYVSHN